MFKFNYLNIRIADAQKLHFRPIVDPELRRFIYSKQPIADIFKNIYTVYGDIGTSPLYTVKEIFSGTHHLVPITPDNILKILSLIFWSLIIVVALKYIIFVMRADNRGEGGIMTLMALVLREAADRPYAKLLMLFGLFGAALFYGDSIITPAISVLSAAEGLEIITPAFKPYILPIALVVLIALFMVQKYGTSKIGKLFGPIMVLWFCCLGLLSLINIANSPQALAAFNPIYARRYFVSDPAPSCNDQVNQDTSISTLTSLLPC